MHECIKLTDQTHKAIDNSRNTVASMICLCFALESTLGIHLRKCNVPAPIECVSLAFLRDRP